MEFRIDDITLPNPRVADAVVRCLQQCDRALNAVLVETEALMPADDWKLLRRGVGRIAGGDMFDLWHAVVKQHPEYETACYGEPTLRSRDHRHD
jgi:hypothetical protein